MLPLHTLQFLLTELGDRTNIAFGFGHRNIDVIFVEVIAIPGLLPALLLPLLLYTITVPVIIAGVRATGTLLQPEVDFVLVRFWVLLLVCFDVVFVTLALWTFEPLMTD